MHSLTAFQCFVLTPLELLGVSIGTATISAGGIAILDREFCPDDDLDQAMQSLNQLLNFAAGSGAVGVRMRVDQIIHSQAMLSQVAQHPHWLILSAWEAQELEDVLEALPQGESRRVLLEVTSVEQALRLGKHHDVAGLVVRGQECGGWTGEDSSFILLQRLLTLQSLPLYVQGGGGPQVAAACRGLGAAGVVLDDQLWLMPESPLPEPWQALLRSLTGQEAMALGERVGHGCRVLVRPGMAAVTQLKALAEQIEVDLGAGAEADQRWYQQAGSYLGWGNPETNAWPMGQGVGLAASLLRRFGTTGKLIRSILANSGKQLRLAHDLQPLRAGAPLAVSHGTPYPIVQGPMTRVSDTAEFANAVSLAGALPLLALAMMRGSQVRDLLNRTQALLGDRPWGVGLLGFAPKSLRDEQIEAIYAAKPPFALIAGGRPDQAAAFEKEGIASYLHVPSPVLLKLFLEQGARRFVFEGRECGGHVGPLSSFVLWESMVDTLLSEVGPDHGSEIHVLFAGGIHDSCSAAFISVLAAPLAQRGMKVGVLMGTAYLFTHEAVDCGAILPSFQEQALRCDHTVNLETGVGHASRCAVTPFADEFYSARRAMLAAGDSAEEIKDALEALTLGRLRLASKGLVREDDGVLTAVDAPRRHRDGMYMIGQVATLRNQVISAEQLHQELVYGAAQWLNRRRPAQLNPAEYGPDRPSDIAVIGIGTLLPDAQEPQDYWLNILNKVDSIQEIPASRWDWRLYYDADPQARDRIYSKWGGFLDDVPFDPLRFGIPPKSLKSIEPLQLLALEVVRRALEDAGYATGEFDRENTSVILGAGGGLADLGQQYATRSEIPRYVENPDEGVWDRLPEWSEESFPGVLLNVIAGRVANRFDLRGTNHTVDAACASSLAAIDLAVKDLESGHSNMAIVGGVDTIQSPFAFYCFSKSQALSPRGRCRSFDQSADGIAISEGLAVVVLKRLADAERDGDRIYGVIKAVGGSSDGKALGMTAPRPEGQMLALGRAYGKAGFAPSTLGLYEAHGTGTAVGDRAELETLVTTMNDHQAYAKTCVLGSVKTMIGHTKSTAGVAGLVKAVLALHHRVQPPHANVELPLSPITDPNSPVYLLKEARPWIAHPDYPRRAGVSAFGFGGTNFHAVLEEYAAAPVTSQGADRWPCELLIFRAASMSALVEEIEQLRRALATGARPRLVDLAFSYVHRAQARQADKACLSLVVESLEQLEAALELTLNHLRQGKSPPLPPHISLGLDASIANQSIAFLFPGQGSQYPNMAREVALYCPEMRQSIEFADRSLDADQLGGRLSSFIYPPSSYSGQEEEDFRLRLTNTQIAQPALGALAAGYIDLAARLGLKPAMTCGHSYGEYGALYCAGVLSREDFLNLSATRGRVMATACADSDGAMAAVQAARDDLMPHLEGFGQVVIANHNSPSQSVISGPTQAINEVVDSLNKAGILARLLPVSGAFHSPLVSSAQEAMEAPLATATLRVPAIPVYTNATATLYASEPEAIRQQLSAHLTSPVNFLSQIEAIYQAGARVFVELGPKSVLTKLVDQILEGLPLTAVSFDGQGGRLSGFLAALGKLSTKGVGLQLQTLFDGRDVARLDLDRLEKYQESAPPRSAWFVNGGDARPQGVAVSHTGKRPPLTLEQKLSAAAHPRPVATATPLVSPPQEPEAGTKRLTNIPGTPTLAISPISQSAQSRPMTYPDQPDAQALQDPILVAYQAHQATMFQFLAVQERVVSQFLECQRGRMGSSAPALAPATAQVQPLGMPVAPPIDAMASEQLPAPAAVSPAPLPGSTHLFSAAPARTVQNGLAQSAVSPNGSIKNGQSPTHAFQAGVEHPLKGASSPAPVPAREELMRQLLDLVSDRTGYPTDMLGLDQDLEAELGIDSIKRVEILGAMQKILGADLAALLQQDMEALTRVKTLNGLIDRLLGALPAPLSLPEPGFGSPPAVNTELVPAAGLDRAQMISSMLELVSDRTGYPTDMLGLDQDLEAELGIDSIKRVEILGALQKTLPPALGDLFQQQMEQMTRTKSLNALADQLMALASSSSESRLGKSPLPQPASPAT